MVGHLKTHLWLFCQQFNSYRTHKSRITLVRLETEILKLQNKLAKQENKTNYKLLLERRTQLGELLQKKVAWLLVRLRIQNLKVWDRPSKSFFQVESEPKPFWLFFFLISNGPHWKCNYKFWWGKKIPWESSIQNYFQKKIYERKR